MELKVISIDEIQPNPFQPRESFEKESLNELADSIKGVAQRRQQIRMLQPLRRMSVIKK